MEEKILKLLTETVLDNQNGYDKLESDYWLGRLCLSEELKLKIERMDKDYD